jgi:Fe-S-cluster containining protein
MIHANGTLDALEVDRFREALRGVYDDLDAEVAALAPVCQISGRCCRFEEYGHTLFVSAPEFALLLADGPPPGRPMDDGATCPWQDEKGRCSAREARPMGCRVYFCDPKYQPMAPEIAEAGIARLKRLVDDLGLAWDYAPLHVHLRRAAEEGTFPAIVPERSNAQARDRSLENRLGDRGSPHVGRFMA